jgi:DNA-binding CsgD family transcriptional regulator
MRPGIEHGTLTAFKTDGCKCVPCNAANTRYVGRRNRLIAYGQWQPYVDAEPVRQHVLKLREAGLGYKRVAQLAGVPNGGMSKLLYGDYGRSMAPSKRVRPETATAILAVEANLDTLGGTALVDCAGTRRRLHALVATGWSLAKLADRLGISRGNLGKTLATDRVHASTARTVRALYDELWDQAPPEATHRDKIAASRTRNIARVRGWPPPQAWDDDTIDDPAATADLGGKTPRPVALFEDSEELIRDGHTLAQAAERLGVTAAYLNEARARAQKAKAVA